MSDATEQTKHTPGPWELDEDEDLSGEFSIEIFHRGAPIASVYGTDEFPCADECSEEAVAAEVVANAHLIAAAPELLALLVEFQTAIGAHLEEYRPEACDDAEARIRAAINKALGTK